MAQGFIYAKLPNDTTVFAKSAHILSFSSSSSSSSPSFTSIDNLVNGDLKLDCIVCQSAEQSNNSGSKSKTQRLQPVLSVKSYQDPIDPHQLPIAVVVGLIPAPSASSSSSSSCSDETLKREAAALNQFAYSCVSSTSKPTCESLWTSILNYSSINSSSNNNVQTTASAATKFFSNTSLSPCGFPRSIIDRAVPLSFCFVPPPVLGGETLNFFTKRRINPLVDRQDRILEIKSSMPWNYDYNLTEHIVDSMRIFSSFVADATISNVGNDLLNSRFASSLVTPDPALAKPKDPRHATAVANSMIFPSEAAQGSFFGRGTWFTGLFAANDGAVIAATGGFFRLNLDDQILVTTLVSDSAAAARTGNAVVISSSSSSSSSTEVRLPKMARHAGNFTGGATIKKNNASMNNPNLTSALPNNTNNNNNANAASSIAAAAAQATTLPPRVSFFETQVRFFISISGIEEPLSGSVAVFTLDDNLRFVVGMPHHQPQLAQRTASEVFMWTSQLLENSLQTVSAREVAKFCSNQRDPEEGILGFCLSCCGGGGGGNRQQQQQDTTATGVPFHGLRNISYLTPGLLRHYSSILESSIASVVMRQATLGGKYFGVPSQDLMRLSEAASFYEFVMSVKTPKNNNGNGNNNNQEIKKLVPFRYFIEMVLTTRKDHTQALSEGNVNNTISQQLPVLLLNPGFNGKQLLSSFENASLLNSRSWKELFKFSDLVMVDDYKNLITNNANNNNNNKRSGTHHQSKSSAGLAFGYNEKKFTTDGINKNFSVASFSVPLQQNQQQLLSGAQYSDQTEKCAQSVKHLHWCLQSILYSAVKCGSGIAPPTKEAK